MHQVGKKKKTRNVQVCSGNQRREIRETTNARECKPILCRFACDWKGSENRQAVTWKIILSLSVWHWLVPCGILAPTLRNYSYSEKYEPCGHYSLGFMETWNVPKKDNTGFLLSSQNLDKSRIREKKQASEKSLFHATRRKMVVLVVMGWQGSKQYEQECVGSVVGCCGMWAVN